MENIPESCEPLKKHKVILWHIPASKHKGSWFALHFFSACKKENDRNMV